MIRLSWRVQIASLLVFSVALCHEVQAENKAIMEYTPANGPFKVESATLDVFDLNRNRQVPLKMSFPHSSDKFPLIVFSHGAGGSEDSYEDLVDYWVSHGYVVIRPDHEDSIAYARKKGRKLTLAEVLRNLPTNYSGWFNRAYDVKSILDSLQEISLKPQVAGVHTTGKIGMAGHSYGAFTAGLLEGGKVQLPKGKAPDLTEHRFSAFLLMSPQGYHIQELGFAPGHGFDSFKSPTMFMTGSADRGMGKESPQWRVEGYSASPPGDKYLVFIDGANHMTFVGSHQLLGLFGSPSRLSNRSAANSKLFDYVKMSTLAFWDAYLKNSARARAYLQSDSLSKVSAGIAKITDR